MVANKVTMETNVFKSRKKIDLFGTSVQEVWDELVSRGYTDERPSGGYDFPSGAILSKYGKAGSDLHVDVSENIPTNVFDVEVSEYDDFAYMSQGVERGPSTTDSPFIWRSSLLLFPGYFGEALKAYVEVRCILLVYNVNVAGLDSWFKESWGVPEEFSLDFVTPNVRSQPPALWGGVSRVLKPFLSMLPATGPALHVTHHGVHRTKFGKSKLVDWSRISVIAEAIGKQILVDDMTTHRNITRMDFKIVGSEIPSAPIGSSLQVEFVYERKNFQIMQYYTSMEAIISKAKKFEKKILAGVSKENVSVNAEVELNVDSTVQLLGKQTEAPFANLGNWWEDESELDLLTPVNRIEVPRGKYVTYMNFTNTVLLHRVHCCINQLPRVHELMFILAKMDNAEMDEFDNAFLLKVCTMVYGSKFLVLMEMCGNICSRVGGRDWVAKFLKDIKYPLAKMNYTNLIGLFNSAIKQPECIKSLVQILMPIIRDVDYEQSSTFLTDVTHEMAQSENPAILVARIIQKKRKYWVSRLLRNAKSRKRAKNSTEHLIVSQLRSKVLRRVKIEVDKKMQIIFSQDNIDAIFLESVNNFIRHRAKGKNIKSLKLINSIKELQAVDKDYGLKHSLSFTRMFEHVMDYLNEFGRDIVSTFEDMFVTPEILDEFNADSEDEVYVDWEYVEKTQKVVAIQSESEEKSLFGLVKSTREFEERYAFEEAVECEVQEQMDVDNVETKDEEKKEVEDPFAWMFDDPSIISAPAIVHSNEVPGETEEDIWGSVCAPPVKMTPKVPEIDVQAELKESYPNLRPQEIADCIHKFGKLAPYTSWDAIDVYARSVIQKRRGVNAGLDFDEPDII